MPCYHASVFYNEETIKLLDATLQRTFRYWVRYIMLFICVFFLSLGVHLGAGSTIGLISIILGCLAAPFVAGYILPSSAAQRSTDFMRGKKILMEYVFSDDSFTCIAGNNRQTVFKYDMMIRLIDDKDYLYLCTSRNQACMIEKRTIQPPDCDVFKVFISRRVGLQWTVPPRFLVLSMKTIRFNRDNTRRNSIEK